MVTTRPTMQKNPQYHDFPPTNVDRAESDSSSASSTSYGPIVLRFEKTVESSKKRKNEGDTSIQGHSRSHFPQKDKCSRSQRSHQCSPGGTLNNTTLALSSSTASVESVSIPAGPMVQQSSNAANLGISITSELRTAPTFTSGTRHEHQWRPLHHILWTRHQSRLPGLHPGGGWENLDIINLSSHSLTEDQYTVLPSALMVKPINSN